MKVHILSCQIFEVYINEIQKNQDFSYEYTVEYLEIDQHNNPAELLRILQERIDSIKDVDLIVLMYGICGNSTTGIIAKHVPIMIPRVHDCATILLGGKDAYQKHLGHRPSQGWTCLSYDKGDVHEVNLQSNKVYLEYVEKYGEDNAIYLFETLYPPNAQKVYITLGLDEDHKRMESLDENVELIEGNLEYLKNVLSLQFDDVLVLEPGDVLEPVYDFDDVMKKKSLR